MPPATPLLLMLLPPDKKPAAPNPTPNPEAAPAAVGRNPADERARAAALLCNGPASAENLAPLAAACDGCAAAPVLLVAAVATAPIPIPTLTAVSATPCPRLGLLLPLDFPLTPMLLPLELLPPLELLLLPLLVSPLAALPASALKGKWLYRQATEENHCSHDRQLSGCAGPEVGAASLSTW